MTEFSYIRDSPDVVLHRLAHFSALYRFRETDVRISIEKFRDVVDCTKHGEWTPGALVMGNIADRHGNRIVMRVLIFIAGCVPLLAVGLSRLPMARIGTGLCMLAWDLRRYRVVFLQTTPLKFLRRKNTRNTWAAECSSDSAVAGIAGGWSVDRSILF